MVTEGVRATTVGYEGRGAVVARGGRCRTRGRRGRRVGAGRRCPPPWGSRAQRLREPDAADGADPVPWGEGKSTKVDYLTVGLPGFRNECEL